jgi:hypothetical protein
MSGVFRAGRAEGGEFVCVLTMPLLSVFDLIDREGGDREDAAHLLEALMRGIYTTFPELREEAQES